MTGRANRFDQLIRKGSDGPAIIRVSIRNVGPNAYKFEEYRDRVIVERIIRKASNVSKLLNAK